MEHTEENLQENLQQDSSENLDNNNIIPESLSEELVTENTQDSKEQKEPCRIINFPDQDRLGNLLLTIVESYKLSSANLKIWNLNWLISRLIESGFLTKTWVVL